MRIVHVATLVTPDNAYGGPVTVALNQLRELAERGHEVTLVAGCAGFASPPRTISGVKVKLFPVRRVIPRTGFAGLVAPGLGRWLRAESAQIDVAHVHLSRELVVLPATRTLLRQGVPVVLQTHGMIDESDRLLSKPLDRVWTRRTLRAAATILHLTPTERDSLRVVGGTDLPLRFLKNGVPRANAAPSAEIRPSRIDVLYLARLQARKRPQLFVSAAIALADAHPEARFTLVGPDEGMGEQVGAMIEQADLGDRLQWTGPLPPEETLDRIRRCDIYVLPSIDEPFPMSVLEALSVGKPVVITDTCGLAPAVREAEAGVVTTAEPKSLTDAIDRLLGDRALRLRLGANALDLVDREFSMSAVVDDLLKTYDEAITSIR